MPKLAKILEKSSVFTVRNTIKAGQSWSSAVICRNRSDFEMQFRLIVVSILLKTCVKDRGSRLLISCKAVKRGLQFAIFFVNFVLTNGTVSYYSRYCLQVIIVLIHVYNWEIRHQSTVFRCALADIYIYFFIIFFIYFFFNEFMRLSRNSYPRGVQNRISLEAAMLELILFM